MQIYINLFGLTIPSYGLMIAAGFIFSNLIAAVIINKMNFDINDFIIIQAYLFFSGILGAKILYLLVSYKTIDISRISDLKYIHSLADSGFVFYGGIIGGILILPFIYKVHKINVKEYLSSFIFMLPMIHAFGRIGCFLAGCCYGIPAECCISVVFPENSFAPSGIKLFPIQLAEAVFLFILSFLLLYLIIKKKTHITIFLYILCYSVLRFILEFLRYDAQRGKLFIFSTSQWISILLFFIFCSAYILKKAKIINSFYIL